jgi:hypothetical protein
MDTTQEKTLEEVLAGITIEDAKSGYEYVGSSDPYYGAVPPLTVSNIDGNINGMNYSNISLTGGGYTIGTSIIGGAGQNWTTGTTSPYPFNPVSHSATIQLDGDNADIKVNGWSLVDAIQKIEERLNILHPNTKLEAEWEELRDLGAKYRELEQHIRDKQATWDRLKAMPPPVVE